MNDACHLWSSKDLLLESNRRTTRHRAGRIHRRDEKRKKEKIDFEIHGKIYEYCYTAVLPW
jgi:hypothetical protein